MKIEKINDAFVNEFDAQAQGCSDDCNEYRGSSKADINWQKRNGVRSYSEWDRTDCENVISLGMTYCYLDKTPKTCIYW